MVFLRLWGMPLAFKAVYGSMSSKHSMIGPLGELFDSDVR